MCVCYKSCCTSVEDGRPVPDVHGGRGFLGAQQFTDDRRGHHAGRVTDLQGETREYLQLVVIYINIIIIFHLYQFLKMARGQLDSNRAAASRVSWAALLKGTFYISIFE